MKYEDSLFHTIGFLLQLNLGLLTVLWNVLPPNSAFWFHVDSTLLKSRMPTTIAKVSAFLLNLVFAEIYLYVFLKKCS